MFWQLLDSQSPRCTLYVHHIHALSQLSQELFQPLRHGTLIVISRGKRPIPVISHPEILPQDLLSFLDTQTPQPSSNTPLAPPHCPCRDNGDDHLAHRMHQPYLFNFIQVVEGLAVAPVRRDTPDAIDEVFRIRDVRRKGEELPHSGELIFGAVEEHAQIQCRDQSASGGVHEIRPCKAPGLGDTVVEDPSSEVEEGVGADFPQIHGVVVRDIPPSSAASVPGGEEVGCAHQPLQRDFPLSLTPVVDDNVGRSQR